MSQALTVQNADEHNIFASPEEVKTWGVGRLWNSADTLKAMAFAAHQLGQKEKVQFALKYLTVVEDEKKARKDAWAASKAAGKTEKERGLNSMMDVFFSLQQKE